MEWIAESMNVTVVEEPVEPATEGQPQGLWWSDETKLLVKTTM